MSGKQCRSRSYAAAFCGIWSGLGNTLFAQACLSQSLGILWYLSMYECLTVQILFRSPPHALSDLGPHCLLRSTCTATDEGGIHIIFFLFLHENICCRYSLEVPHRGASNEYPQHMFLWRNKKDISIFLIKNVPYLLLCICPNT